MKCKKKQDKIQCCSTPHTSIHCDSVRTYIQQYINYCRTVFLLLFYMFKKGKIPPENMSSMSTALCHICGRWRNIVVLSINFITCTLMYKYTAHQIYYEVIHCLVQKKIFFTYIEFFVLMSLHWLLYIFAFLNQRDKF